MKKIASLLIILLIGVAMDADAKKKARKFYLTQDFFTGSQALTACANKFHLASLWEILKSQLSGMIPKMVLLAMILAQALLPAPHKVGFQQGLKLSALILRESAIATHGQVLLDLELLSF